MKKLCLMSIVLFAPAAGAAFKCTDEKGLTYFGDTPPAQCTGVPVYELRDNGMVIRRIDPTPTPEQVKAKTAESERAKAAQRATDEQTRKDEALLNSFSNEREFDVVRDRNIEPIKGRIASAKDRIKAVETRQKQLEDEMEFYKAGKKANKDAGGQGHEAAPMLAAELQRIAGEKQTLERSIVAHEKEIAELRAKFDVDRKRWVALKSGTTPKGTVLPAAAPNSADASSTAKKP